jgi:glutamate synthase domain-containing protein 2
MVPEDVAHRVWTWLRRVRVRRHESFANDVTRALALPPRGGISRDVLRLESVSTHMALTWTARAFHPWDRHLPSGEQDESFAIQCLEDVDAAVTRLFERFDIVESLDVDVVHPVSQAKILSGRVSRADFVANARVSIAMRLKMAGLAYEFGRGGLQPLAERTESSSFDDQTRVVQAGSSTQIVLSR